MKARVVLAGRQGGGHSRLHTVAKHFSNWDIPPLNNTLNIDVYTPLYRTPVHIHTHTQRHRHIYIHKQKTTQNTHPHKNILRGLKHKYTTIQIYSQNCLQIYYS